jgi:hydrogenase maturation factor HypF (carbamoyltransferase family)
MIPFFIFLGLMIYTNRNKPIVNQSYKDLYPNYEYDELEKEFLIEEILQNTFRITMRTNRYLTYTYIGNIRTPNKIIQYVDEINHFQIGSAEWMQIEDTYMIIVDMKPNMTTKELYVFK